MHHKECRSTNLSTHKMKRETGRVRTYVQLPEWVSLCCAWGSISFWFVDSWTQGFATSKNPEGRSKSQQFAPGVDADTTQGFKISRTRTKTWEVGQGVKIRVIQRTTGCIDDSPAVAEVQPSLFGGLCVGRAPFFLHFPKLLP